MQQPRQGRAVTSHQRFGQQKPLIGNALAPGILEDRSAHVVMHHSLPSFLSCRNFAEGDMHKRRPGWMLCEEVLRVRAQERDRLLQCVEAVEQR
jgi:hypothetical protein